MTTPIDYTAISVFVFFLLLITATAFLATRWKRGDLHQLEEWGLAGRRFGTVITWFLLGGDLFTAYTMIAVPALVYGIGAPGFFALPYSTLTFPLAYATMPRLWAVCRKHGYVTAADFVRGRYGDHWLALAIALTGILATVPYIALQLIGIQVSIGALGLSTGGLGGQLPLMLAFVLLVSYTYTGGLRAPASIAFIKDAMLYIVVLTTIIWLPLKLGGYAHIFQSAAASLANRPNPASIILHSGQHLPFATLVLGSSFALFLYPHSITAVLSSSSAAVIKRNSALLPAYSMLLGMIALLGYGALAAGVKVSSSSYVVPALFLKIFPPWFAGFCFASIAIGALVPAAIMSIAAASLFTRNICREYLWVDLSHREETRLAKILSMTVSLAALLFILFLPTQYAINLQLLGGIWIVQTLPAVVIGLFTRWLHSTALLIGWMAGMAAGTAMVISQRLTAVFPLHVAGVTISSYAAVDALLLNLVISYALTFVLNALGKHGRTDQTSSTDYDDSHGVAEAAMAK
jgi:solute:Na+ symporter, SSS family